MSARPRVVAIVQARMTSTRLPGKVLADLDGNPLLVQMLRRLHHARTVDQIVVATTSNDSDDAVCEAAASLGVAVYRGSEQDVLGRYCAALREHRADVVVRITADCPLIDPEIVDRVVSVLLGDPRCDYASNVVDRTYPQGLDVEAIAAPALLRAAAQATSQLAREHVTWHIVREDPRSFEMRSVTATDDHARLRWTVDTPVDLELVRRIYADLELSSQLRGYREILAHVMANPELQALNQHIEQRHL